MKSNQQRIEVLAEIECGFVHTQRIRVSVIRHTRYILSKYVRYTIYAIRMYVAYCIHG